MISWGRFEINPMSFVDWDEEMFVNIFYYIDNADKLWKEIEKANGSTTTTDKKSKEVK
jgi:hypothetical protein